MATLTDTQLLQLASYFAAQNPRDDLVLVLMRLLMSPTDVLNATLLQACQVLLATTQTDLDSTTARVAQTVATLTAALVGWQSEVAALQAVVPPPPPPPPPTTPFPPPDPLIDPNTGLPLP